MVIGLESEDLVRLLLSLAVGGAIGLEREIRDKAAGLRTIIFICVGSTLFTLLSVKLGGSNEMARIASNIVVGVGFLGAGTILREAGRIIGLTTAAVVWLVAALGMAIGAGQYGLALATAVIALIVLRAFPLVERLFSDVRQESTVEILVPHDRDHVATLEGQMRAEGLQVNRMHQKRSEGTLAVGWRISGKGSAVRAEIERLMADAEIEEVKVS